MERLKQVRAGLQRSHCPVVMVLAAPAVDAACTQRNGLTLNGTVGGERCTAG